MNNLTGFNRNNTTFSPVPTGGAPTIVRAPVPIGGDPTIVRAPVPIGVAPSIVRAPVPIQAPLYGAPRRLQRGDYFTGPTGSIRIMSDSRGLYTSSLDNKDYPFSFNF